MTSRYFIQQDEWFARFERDPEGTATGRIDWVPSTYEATGFDLVSDLAELAEWTHLAGFEIVTA